jgi:hypothetical protein
MSRSQRPVGIAVISGVYGTICNWSAFCLREPSFILEFPNFFDVSASSTMSLVFSRIRIETAQTFLLCVRDRNLL